MQRMLASNQPTLALYALESACGSAIAEQRILRELRIAGKTKRLRYLDTIIEGLSEAFPQGEHVPQDVASQLRALVLHLRGVRAMACRDKMPRGDRHCRRATSRVDTRLSKWLLAREPFCSVKKKLWHRFWKSHDGLYP